MKEQILTSLGKCGYKGRDIYFYWEGEERHVFGEVSTDNLIRTAAISFLERLDLPMTQENLLIAKDCFHIRTK